MNYIYYIAPVASDPQFTAKRQIVREVAQRAGISVHFPLEQATGQTLQSLRDSISMALCVIADLSFERPSVYFEMGLAAALGAKLILIAERGSQIHQIPPGLTVSRYSEIVSYEYVIRDVVNRAQESPQQ